MWTAPLNVVRFDATTLWHFDAAERAPSTTSKSASRPRLRRGRNTPESGHADQPPGRSIDRRTAVQRRGATICYHRPMPSPRRFPPPWSIEESDACYIVKDRGWATCSSADCANGGRCARATCVHAFAMSKKIFWSFSFSTSTAHRVHSCAYFQYSSAVFMMQTPIPHQILGHNSLPIRTLRNSN
jgi:hypothetical protein